MKPDLDRCCCIESALHCRAPRGKNTTIAMSEGYPQSRTPNCVHVDNLSDGVHPVVRSDGMLTQRADFDWAAIDGESESQDSIPIATATSAVIRLLHWITAGTSLRLSGARAAALVCLLDPIDSRYPSLAAIAADAGVTRANVSKWIQNLRAEHRLGLCFRTESARQNYRAGQIRALERGTHPSIKVRTKITEGDPMTYSENAAKFRTLTQALDEVTKLQAELEQKSVKAATPTPAPVPRPSPRPTPRPAPVPRPPSRQLADLSMEELHEVAELANRQNCKQILADAYREICARREKNR